MAVEEYRGMLMVSGRDFVICKGRAYLDNGTIILCGTSVTHGSHPPGTKFVRGDARAGFVIRPILNDPTSCEVTYVSTIDLKGALPSAIIAQLAKEQPMCIARIRAVMLKEPADRPMPLTHHKQSTSASTPEPASVIGVVEASFHHLPQTSTTPENYIGTTPENQTSTASTQNELPESSLLLDPCMVNTRKVSYSRRGEERRGEERRGEERREIPTNLSNPTNYPF